MPEISNPVQASRIVKRPVNRRGVLEAARNLKPLREGFSYVIRFSVGARILHLIVMTCVAILAVTGLAQSFDTTRPAQVILLMLGGLEGTQQVHHFFALVLIAATLYHIAVVTDSLLVKLQPASMLPDRQDFGNFFQVVAFNLGLSKKLPQYDRYSFDEKVVYWVTVISVLVMVVTGLIMWFPSVATQVFPGTAYLYAIAIHRWEAIFILVVMVFLHLYQVLVRKLNFSIFNGQMSMAEMLADHPIELATLEKLAPLAEAQKLPKSVVIPVPDVVVNIPPKIKTPRVNKPSPSEEQDVESEMSEPVESQQPTTPPSGVAS